MTKNTLSILIISLSLLALSGYLQNTVTQALLGFDVVRNDIPHGKIDTASYSSATVGTTRKVIIYTPPVYSKEKKYPVLYFLHGVGGGQSLNFGLGNLDKFSTMNSFSTVRNGGVLKEYDATKFDVSFDYFHIVNSGLKLY